MRPGFRVEIDAEEFSEGLEMLDLILATQIDREAVLDGREDFTEYGVEGFSEVDSQLFESMLNALNFSAPAVELSEDPEDHVKSIYENRAIVDRGVREFVFAPYDVEEISSSADVGIQDAFWIREGKVTPPEDVFYRCFNEVREAYDYRMDAIFDIKSDQGRIQIEDGSVLERPSFLIEDASIQELLDVNNAVRDLERLESNDEASYGVLRSNKDLIDQVKETLSDEQSSNYINKSDGENGAFRGLNSLGVTEKFSSSSSAYEIKASETYIEALEALLD